jgi:hypothetical protein
MIKESSGAATKDTRSVDERHEVYEEQLCCTKSSRAATKELQGSYEYNENSGAVRSIVFIVVLNRRIASEFGSCIKSTKQIVTFKVYW